jgi:tetratricopeptide (TPR) repeat protein
MPQDPLVELNINATVHKLAGATAKAEHLYREVLRFSSSTEQAAIALYGLGELYSDQGRYDEATDFFKRAVGLWVKLHPADAESVLWFSDALIRLQHAIEQYAKAGTRVDRHEMLA